MGHRLYVGNLAGSTHAETLRAEFSAMGEVTGVDLVTNPDTGQPAGYAFVTMGSAHEALTAIYELNGKLLEGRTIRVNEAEERQPFDE
jgi:cold-inducible RNA-binding protein